MLNTDGLRYETFIAGNEIYVWGGSLDVATDLAVLPEVRSIRATRTYHIDPVIVNEPLKNISWAGDFLTYNAHTTVGSSPEAITDWGITDTKADQFWAAYGRGLGMVVANIYRSSMEPSCIRPGIQMWWKLC